MRERTLDDNEHLELHFLMATDELAVDFAAQKDRPELTKLYNLLADYGAEVRCMADMFNPPEEYSAVLGQLTEALQNSPHASEIKRRVRVMLPHDGNLKTLWRNITKAPSFAGVIEQDKATIEIGGSWGMVGWIDDAGALVMAEHPEFEAPVHPPAQKGFHYG